jgi:hypothetical protein
MEPSRWSLTMKDSLIEAIAQAGYGRELSYTELGRVIGLQPGEADSVHGRQLIHRAANAAKRPLLVSCSRVLVSVRGKGYRVALPSESASIAISYRDGAERKIKKAVDTLAYTDEREMTAAERQRHQATRMLILDLQSRMNSAEDRLNLLERVVFGTGEQAQA